MVFFKRKKALVTKKFNNFFYADILEKNNENNRVRFLCKSRKNLYFKNQFIVVGDEVIISEINLAARFISLIITSSPTTINSFLKYKFLRLLHKNLNLPFSFLLFSRIST